MAREVKVVIRISDDLDPDQEAEVTHYVGLDGQWYELDLTTAHGSELADALKRFTSAGRKVPDAKMPTVRQIAGSRGGARGGHKAAALNREIREWALAQDPPLPVTSNGGKGWYVPAETRRAWESAAIERKVS